MTQPRPGTGIALGSNMGDRLSALRAGLELLLERAPESRLLAAAPVYETEPVDCAPGTQAFLNTVVEIQTSLDPVSLRRLTAAIERELGRPDHRARNAPRPLDLDLLYHGDMVLDHPELQLPHPRMTQRRFVLAPLADIRPGLVLPGRAASVRDLLDALPADPAARLVTAADWHCA
jgi:2-amino-4-hydroxy-6-hydroxymethyldihydropteridine diphosphokinase